MNSRNIGWAVLGVVLFGLGLFGWMEKCTGADPTIDSVELRPPESPGEAYVVDVEVRNTSTGLGVVDIEVTLTDRETGRQYRAESQVELLEGDSAVVAVEVPAPVGNYEAEASAHYPQE